MNKPETVLTDEEIRKCEQTASRLYIVHARAIEQAVLAKLAEKNEPVAYGFRDKHWNIMDCITPAEHDREPGAYDVALYTRSPTIAALLEAAEKAKFEFEEIAEWVRLEKAPLRRQEVESINTRIEELRAAIEASKKGMV